MALTKRKLTGIVRSPGDGTPATQIVLETISGNLPADASRVIQGPTEYTLTAGALSGNDDIWAPGYYKATIIYPAQKGNEVIHIAVPEGAAGSAVAFQDLVRNTQAVTDPSQQVMYREDLVTHLSSGGSVGILQGNADGTLSFNAAAGSGDMMAAMYDPQEIGNDAFDRANHTGTQAISTVSGLQTALDAKATAASLTSHTANTSNPHSTTATQVGALSVGNNLSDLNSAAAARTNLNLGTAATRNVPASGNAASSEVVLGSDTRLGAGKTYVRDVIVHETAAGTLSQTINAGAFRIRFLTKWLSSNGTSSSIISGAIIGTGGFANLFQLPAGTYLGIDTVAHYAYTVRHRTRIRSCDASNIAALDPTHPIEFYAQGANSGDTLSKDTPGTTSFTLSQATWFAIEADVQMGGTGYEGGFNGTSGSVKADGSTLVPEQHARITITKEV